MDRREFVHKRKGRYMAQTLDEFEQDVEPLIPQEVAAKFKGTIRRKLNALAVDAAELLELADGDLEQNGYAQDLRDRLDTR